MSAIQYKDANITVYESALFRTTSTLIETDDILLLVDPNWLPNEIECLQLAVHRQRNNKPFFVLFTHSDYDHIIGYRAFPTAQIIASQAFVDNKGRNKILEQIKDWDDENYIRRNYPIDYPSVDVVIRADGQQLKIGATTLTFYLAPGHNVDGLFTIVEPLGVWIAGDYLSNIEFPYIYHSSLAYEQTMAKVTPILSNHMIKMLITGHGDIALDKSDILKRKEDSIKYITDLRTSLKDELPFDFEKLMKAYHFPKIMKQFHEGNVKLIKKELGLFQ